MEVMQDQDLSVGSMCINKFGYSESGLRRKKYDWALPGVMCPRKIDTYFRLHTTSNAGSLRTVKLPNVHSI